MYNIHFVVFLSKMKFVFISLVIKQLLIILHSNIFLNEHLKYQYQYGNIEFSKTR